MTPTVNNATRWSRIIQLQFHNGANAMQKLFVAKLCAKFHFADQPRRKDTLLVSQLGWNRWGWLQKAWIFYQHRYTTCREKPGLWIQTWSDSHDFSRSDSVIKHEIKLQISDLAFVNVHIMLTNNKPSLKRNSKGSENTFIQ